MRHPSVIAEYVRTYHEERKRLAAQSNAKRVHLELRLGEINREIDRLVDAIAKGHGDPAILGPRSSLLDVERRKITRDLRVEPTASDVISLHPAVLAATINSSSNFKTRCRKVSTQEILTRRKQFEISLRQ